MRLAAPLAVLLSLLLPTLALAQDSGGITVVGTGEARAKPSRAEISATVSGDGPLATDAVAKFQGARKQAQESIQRLGVEGLTLETQGLAVRPPAAANPMAAMMGMGDAEADTSSFTVSTGVKVVLAGIDTMEETQLVETLAKVLDAMKDAGLKLGPPPPANMYEAQMMAMQGGGDGGAVTFRLADAEALREEAYKAAVADARQRAERIARLTGVKLGGVLSVHELPVAEGTDEQPNFLALMMGASSGRGGEALSAQALQEIPLRVSLTVQYEIER